MGQRRWFKGRQFTSEVILWAVRWYLMFPISYRDLELMLLDRGVEVDHTTIFRWIQDTQRSWRSGSVRTYGRATDPGEWMRPTFG
jgi:transposase-like protein